MWRLGGIVVPIPMARQTTLVAPVFNGVRHFRGMAAPIDHHEEDGKGDREENSFTQAKHFLDLLSGLRI
jgi:hypothetical protein